MMVKKDVYRRSFHGWLLQEFDLEVNNMNGMENQVADYTFQDEHLRAVSSVMEPYYADITIFLVTSLNLE